MGEGWVAPPVQAERNKLAEGEEENSQNDSHGLPHTNRQSDHQ
jgi:hypothetical protein